MTVNLMLCAFLLTISPWILNLSSAYAFCSSQELDGQCGEHSYQIIKPMLQYFEQINFKIAESDQKIFAYKNERNREVETIITNKITSLEEKIDRLTEDSEYKKEVISLQKQAELKDAQIGNFQILLQIKEKTVSDLNKANRNSLIQISEMKKTIQSLNNRISQQETQISNSTMLIGEYSTRVSNLTTILQGKGKQVSELEKDFEKKEIANTELKKTIESLNSQISYQKSHVPNNCIDMNNYSGLLSIKLDSLGQFTVSCDSLLAGSGWNVIQRRINGSVDFYRNWEEYKQGFGNVEGEFFIGLEKLHLLTKERRYELYIHLVDQANEVRFARYDNFRVANESNKYELSSIGTYSGNAGDSMLLHKGKQFSTHDKDNDLSSQDCATTRGGGWWYFYCADSNLNGKRFDCALEEISNELEKTGCIFWYHWHGRSYSLKNVHMMIRPWGRE